MQAKITHQHLATLLATADDDAGNHVLWIDDELEVHLSLLSEAVSADEFARSQTNLIAKVQTLIASNGYVGPDAAKDQNWINCLLNCLNNFEAVPGKVSLLSFD